MHLLISWILLLISDCSPCACLDAAALGESTAPERIWWCKTKIFQKYLIRSRTITEFQTPSAIKAMLGAIIMMLGTTWCQVSLGFTVRRKWGSGTQAGGYYETSWRWTANKRVVLSSLLPLTDPLVLRSCRWVCDGFPRAFHVLTRYEWVWTVITHVTWCTTILHPVTWRKYWSTGMHSSRSRYDARYVCYCETELQLHSSHCKRWLLVIRWWALSAG